MWITSEAALLGCIWRSLWNGKVLSGFINQSFWKAVKNYIISPNSKEDTCLLLYRQFKMRWRCWMEFKLMFTNRNYIHTRTNYICQAFNGQVELPASHLKLIFSMLFFCLTVAPPAASWMYWSTNYTSTWLIPLLRTAMAHHPQRMLMVCMVFD